MVAVDVVVLAAVALLAFLVAGLLRSNAELTRAMHHLGIDLSPGAPVSSGGAAGTTTTRRAGTPSDPGPSRRRRHRRPGGGQSSGDALSIAVSGVRHDTLVAFLTSGCSTCRGIWEVFARATPDVPGGARLVAVTRGPEAESPAALAGMAGPHVPVVMSSSVWEAYDVPYAPYFVYVSGAEGRVVGEGAAASWEAVRTMVTNALADGSAPAGAVPTGGGAGAAAAAATDLGQRWAAAETEREQRIDRELAAAGILPGDPRLHPSEITQPRMGRSGGSGGGASSGSGAGGGR